MLYFYMRFRGEFWFHYAFDISICGGIVPPSLLIMMSSLGIILYINWLVTFWYSFCYHNAFWCGAFIPLFILFCTSICLKSLPKTLFYGPVKGVNMNYLKEIFFLFWRFIFWLRFFLFWKKTGEGRLKKSGCSNSH